MANVSINSQLSDKWQEKGQYCVTAAHLTELRDVWQYRMCFMFTDMGIMSYDWGGGGDISHEIGIFW